MATATIPTHKSKNNNKNPYCTQWILAKRTIPSTQTRASCSPPATATAASSFSTLLRRSAFHTATAAGHPARIVPPRCGHPRCRFASGAAESGWPPSSCIRPTLPSAGNPHKESCQLSVPIYLQSANYSTATSTILR
jgi:hypothetical protein